MANPQVGNVLRRFSQPVTLRKYTQTVVNYEPVNTYVDTPIKAVIQPSSAESLNIDIVDYSLRYFMVHSTTVMTVNDRISYKGKDYRLIEVQDWSDYGYYQAIIEEIK
jgi:hypothetical protein